MKQYDLLEEKKLSDGVVGKIKSETPKINDVTQNFKLDVEYRRSKISWVPKIEKFKWLYEKLGIMTNEANENLWNFDIVGMSEPIQYTEYDKSYKGYYDWHMDIGNGDISKRKISFTIQLSEPWEYEGGELQFMISKDIITFAKERGSVICFPSFFMHRVRPVTKGNRKSLVLWISGPPYR